MMYGNNFVFWWCCALLLVASSSKHQRNFTNNNKKHENSTVQYEFDENSMNNYDDETEMLLNWIKNSIKDVNNVQHEFGTNDFTSFEHDKTDFNDDGNVNIVPFDVCFSTYCFPLCCHLDDQLTDKCIPGEEQVSNVFRNSDSFKSENEEIDLFVTVFIYDPYKSNQFFMYLYRDTSKDLFISNDTAYFPYFPYYKKNVKPKSFCQRYDMVIFEETLPREDLRISIYETDSPDNPLRSIIYHKMIIRLSLHILSILFLLATFLVYSIIPELRNKHGFILCNCIGVMIVAYIFESANNIINYIQLGYSNYILGYFYYIPEYSSYIIIAFVCYFCFLAAYIWLSVMSFDMWWTFKYIIKDRNRQQERERKKKDRKKLIMYSVYVWGSSFILTILCINMKFIPTVPDLARPEFGIIIWHYYYWFNENAAAGLCYWIPATICSISSICLFISTALKIRRYEKDTTHHLRNFGSQIYDENKKCIIDRAM